jgi:hypothetical protein
MSDKLPKDLKLLLLLMLMRRIEVRFEIFPIKQSNDEMTV